MVFLQFPRKTKFVGTLGSCSLHYCENLTAGFGLLSLFLSRIRSCFNHSQTDSQLFSVFSHEGGVWIEQSIVEMGTR